MNNPFSNFSIFKQMVIILFIFVFYSIYTNIGSAEQILTQVAVTVGSAAVIDIILDYIRKKKFEFPTTALISGLFISMISPLGTSFYILFAAAAIAMLSKHLINIGGRHIFNPTALSLVILFFAIGLNHVWWGMSSLYIVIPLGLYAAYKIKNYYQAGSFLLTFFVLFLVYTLYRGGNLNTVYQLLLDSVILFFALFMIVEPKSSPLTKNGKIVFGFLVAVFVFLFTFVLNKYFLGSGYLAGLVAANILTIAINKYTL